MDILNALIGVITSQHFVFSTMMVLGGAVHLLGTLMEHSAELGKRMTIKQYRKKYPYQLIYGFLAAIACYLIAWKMGELNILSALACGYMGDSLIKKKMAMVK